MDWLSQISDERENKIKYYTIFFILSLVRYLSNMNYDNYYCGSPFQYLPINFHKYYFKSILVRHLVNINDKHYIRHYRHNMYCIVYKCSLSTVILFYHWKHPSSSLHCKSTVRPFLNIYLKTIGRDSPIGVAFKWHSYFTGTDVDVVRDKKLALRTHPHATFAFFLIAIADTVFQK